MTPNSIVRGIGFPGPTHLPRTVAASLAAALLLFAGVSTPAVSSEVPTSLREMTELSLEDLLDIEVISASKKSEPIADAATAIHVITREEIQRSGATSIPEALRGVPGLQVNQIDATRWAITARGSNGIYANKLLVLIDGRSVFGHLFGGVYWENTDTMLEDVERIEVIRGPGGTLWGANAVNGVINVITRTAAESQGTLFVAGTGDPALRSTSSVRHGGSLGEGADYRVWAKHYERANLLEDEVDLDNSTSQQRFGFRLDSEGLGGSQLSFQGDYYDGDNRRNFEMPDFATFTTPVTTGVEEVQGGHVSSRWSRAWTGRRTTEFRAFYDHHRRQSAVYHERQETLDLEIEQSLGLGRSHALMIGAGVRRYADEISDSAMLSGDISSRTDVRWNAFAQDDWAVWGGAVRLIAGTKLEENEFTGLEVQPNLRLSWRLAPRRTVWLAASRAVASPTRFSRDAQYDFAVFRTPTLPGVIYFAPNPDLESEVLMAYEAGHRAQVSDHLSFDLAVFHNRYENLLATRTRDPEVEIGPAGPTLRVEQEWLNGGGATANGVEVGTDLWSMGPLRRLRVGYAYTEVEEEEFIVDEEGIRPMLKSGTVPRHEASVSTWVDLTPRLDLDVAFRYRSELSGMNPPAWDGNVFLVDGATSVSLDDRFDADATVSWRVVDGMTLQVIGKNLLENDEPEFIDYNFGEPTLALPRTIFVKATWGI